MLRRPHPEGGIGAVRVELRGRVGIERRVSVYGAIERPADGETIDILAAVDRFGNAAVKAVLVNGEARYEESLFR